MRVYLIFMQELIIGLGSNLGDRRKNIEKAIALIGERVGRVVAVSSMVETEPWGFESGNNFLNCAIMIPDEPVSDPEKEQPGGGISRPHQIIKIMQAIESEFGRIRTGVYTDRTIDLDILFYGDEIIDFPELTVPHPKLHERDFILISLMELCPDKVHPMIGETIREIYNHRKGAEIP